MHKQTVNELRLEVSITPQGPLLIKSGKEAGADPTLLDMNFVRTVHAQLGETVYLPGSSLKGTLRSYCEKIARTVGVSCCDPLSGESCGKRQEAMRGSSGGEAYNSMCTICRVFGHTTVASHLRISDAYPTSIDRPRDEEIELANKTEQRDGVAIDRISGAVAHGPFQLEVVTQGTFYTQLFLKNFQLWQVGLLAVALRDIAQGRVPLGFAKSRGLGRVALEYNRLEISYPGQFGQDKSHDFGRRLYGVTAFPVEDMKAYGFTEEEPMALPTPKEEEPEWGRVNIQYEGNEEIEALLKATVSAWGDYAVAQRARGD